jgi:hypothetical protein
MIMIFARALFGGGRHERDKGDDCGIGLLLAATPASAMTGQEFLVVYDDSDADKVAAALKPVVRQFVMEGLP